MPARKFLLNPVTTILGALLLLVTAGGLFWLRPAKPDTRSKITRANIILRLSGSNTIGASLAPALAEEFLKQQGATQVQTLPADRDDEVRVQGLLPGDPTPKAIEIHAHGSATAFEDLARGIADIGMSSRRIKPDEATQLASLGDMTSPACEHILALDGIAVIVSRRNSVRVLSKDQIAQIFQGTIGNWQQVGGAEGAIHLYARDDKSGTYDTFKNLVLGNAPLATAAQRIEDSRKLSDAVAQDPNGIGFVGLAYVQEAQAVAVNEKGAAPMFPGPFAVATEDYALSRRLFLYTPAHPQQELTQKFLDFALSSAGQNLVAQVGFVGQNVSAAAVVANGAVAAAVVAADVAFGAARGTASGATSLAKSRDRSTLASTAAPADYRRLTSGSDRLSLDFRFREGSSQLDNKAVADLTRVVTFLHDLHYTGDNLVLLGFDDSKEATDNLSKLRADAVAQQFEQRGVKAKSVVGFGSQLAVASNETPEGRQKNRRVEIWLRR
jgi:phosphate transport system substrate-binding protein